MTYLTLIGRFMIMDFGFKSQEGHAYFAKSDGLKRNFQSMDSSDYHMDEAVSGKSLIYLV